MAAEIELFNDLTNSELVKGLNDKSAFTLKSFFQGAQIDLKLYPIKPIVGAVSPNYYSLVSTATLLPFVYVGPAPGATALLAYQDVWTLDATNGFFRATLNLNTTEMNAAIGSTGTFSTTFEIQWSDSGVRRTTYQSGITMKATVFDPTGAASLPASSVGYYTKAELDAMFVKWDNYGTPSSWGKALNTVSPDGASQRFEGVRNDKSAQDDII